MGLAARAQTGVIRVVRWLLGDIPELARRPGSGALAVWVCSVAAIGMWLGLRHSFKADPVSVGAWRMVVHGAVPLAFVALWELWLRRHTRLAAAGVGAVSLGVTLLLFPVLIRFFDGGPAWLSASSGVAAMPLFGAGLALAGMRRLGADLRDWGIGLGDWRWWLPHHGVLLAALVPVLILVTIAVPALADYYPVNKAARLHFDALVTAHVGLGLDFLGWEFLFRGFLLFAIARRGDALTAILLQAFPFYLLHSPKPELEMLSSFVGGIFAGWFCLRARTFFPLYVIHIVMITTVGCTSFYLRNYG